MIGQTAKNKDVMKIRTVISIQCKELKSAFALQLLYANMAGNDCCCCCWCWCAVMSDRCHVLLATRAQPCRDIVFMSHQYSITVETVIPINPLLNTHARACTHAHVHTQMQMKSIEKKTKLTTEALKCCNTTGITQKICTVCIAYQ